jgi:hypothetical protein
VGIVVGAIDGLRRLLIPTGPGFPVKVAAIEGRGHLVGLVVEETLAHAVLPGVVIELEVAIHHAVHELFDLVDFLLIWLIELFHDSGEPRSGTALVAEPGNPDATILQDDLVEFAIEGHHRGRAMKWIFGVGEPLLRSEEPAHVRNRLSFGLGHKVADRLHRSVGVGD